ncbi:MAG: patatin-like phospholipase family protein [Gammaproteobacteria bacterium]|nr:patatin-like phospholipase family protein [Gammaproteobacteria bacterium]
MATTEPVSTIDWATVRMEELRSVRDHAPESSPDELFGLAFSGGGIRSATFNLGVLQALAKQRLLHDVDFLSTVSGGGYIGGWLTAWLGRERQKLREALPAARSRDVNGRALDTVSEALARNEGIPQIEHLRRFSNYLTPKKSFMSADFWTAITTHFRNTLLNQLMLVPLLMMVCGAAWLFTVVTARWFEADPALRPTEVVKSLTSAALFFAAVFTGFNLVDSDSAPATGAAAQRRRWTGEGMVAFVMAVTFAACWGLVLLVGAWEPPRTATLLATTPLGAKLAALASLLRVEAFATRVGAAQTWQLTPTVQELLFWIERGVVCYVRLVALCGIAMMLGWAVRRWLRGGDGLPAGRSAAAMGRGVLALLLSSLFAGAVGGLVCFGIARVLGLPFVDAHVWLVAGPGTVAIAIAIGVTITLHVGLMGRDFSEAVREWLARAGAWLCIVGVSLLLVFAVTFIAPPVFCRAPAWVLGSGGVGWLVTTGAGLAFGHGAKTGVPGASSTRELVTRLAPYFFVVGLLGLVAEVLYLFFANGPAFEGQDGIAAAFFAESFVGCMERTDVLAWHLPLATCALTLLACFGLVVLMAWRVDVNLFSYHGFYRNRIARCYLGASNAERRPHPFTGFDERDNPQFATLEGRPFHIVSAALNLTSGNHLAWQERSAASYTFTPLYCGYSFGRGAELRGGYYPTPEYRGGGLHLATAVATSGAAASPNMGYHTSPAVAFLLTMFNIRLGWWMPNSNAAIGPGAGALRRWRRGGPRFGLFNILKELFGSVDEDSRYVYVSDGGHFDNMGLYELVRRGCTRIVVCDGEADGAYQFEGIASAIAKCRADLDVDIVLDVTEIRPLADGGPCLAHFVRGEVRYPEGTPGTLLYLKSSLVDREMLAADLRHYAYAHTDFPHQSTDDQWFDESQFEAYRLLGLCIGTAAIKDSFRRDRDGRLHMKPA